jgi:hypothetical protein
MKKEENERKQNARKQKLEVLRQYPDLQTLQSESSWGRQLPGPESRAGCAQLWFP